MKEWICHFLEKQQGDLKLAGSTIKLKLEDSHIGLQEAIRTYDMIDSMKKYDEISYFMRILGYLGFFMI